MHCVQLQQKDLRCEYERKWDWNNSYNKETVRTGSPWTRNNGPPLAKNFGASYKDDTSCVLKKHHVHSSLLQVLGVETKNPTDILAATGGRTGREHESAEAWVIEDPECGD